MALSPRPALSAIAFKIAGALEAYQAEFDVLLGGDRSIEHCRGLSRKLDELLLFAGALPQLAAALVELLVCHTDLLCEALGSGQRAQRARAELVGRHLEAMLAIRARCLRLFSRDAAPA